MPTTRRAEPLGIVRSLPIATYHSDASAISNTGLGDIARSPRHFHALHLDPLRPDRIESASAIASHLEGNVLHCATLEPEAFASRYKVGPCNDRRSAEWKQWHRELRAAVGDGVECITPDQRDVALAQAESVRSDPDIASLMRKGDAEISAYWKDAATGVRCRCRPDFRSPTGKRGKWSILLDLKGYKDARADEFALQVARMDYARQAAFYSDGYAIASANPVVGFVFIVVENTYPYAAAAYMLPDEWLDHGRREYRALLDLYAQCCATNAWPGPSAGIQQLTTPHWITARRTNGA